MKIQKTAQYQKDFKKKIQGKHLKKEEETIQAIEERLINSNHMKEVMLNPLAIVYRIKKKKGDLKEIYTAQINTKIRLYIKPIGEYPYHLEEIIEVSFLEIDHKHYGDG